MADIKQIRAKISEIGQRPKNVQLSEITWVADHLEKNGYKVKIRTNAHQHIFRINGHRFGVCHHNPGSKQIKACYVDAFLDAMTDLKLYED